MSLPKITEMDRRLREQVMNQLDWEPEITSKDISVAVKDGVVTLTGFVHSYFEKIAAEDAAKKTYGVKAVANDIAVTPSSTHTDPELARASRQALEAHVSVPAERIKVMVGAGYVTLEGSVPYYFQKRAAEDALRTLAGVRGVSNLIHVEPPMSADKVKSRIEEAFKRSAEVDSSKIRVQTDGGKVELYGVVQTFAQRQEAKRAAWAAPGVVQVIDHLSIAT